jgi:hypothetical protein
LRQAAYGHSQSTCRFTWSARSSCDDVSTSIAQRSYSDAWHGQAQTWHALVAALDLTPSGGWKCQTLGELLEFVTKLVADDEVLSKLDDSGGKYPEIEPHRWRFRGSRSDRHRLDAGLFRTTLSEVRYPAPTVSYRRLEQRIRHEYTQMSRGRFPGLSENVWDSLFEMQHYGLPTRLLDWSFSLGQALWFAL